MPSGKNVSLLGATALGVGGMIGAGLFTMLGLAAVAAAEQLPLAILVAAGSTGLTAYSYAKLSAHYPSSGGPARFVVAVFGHGVTSGALNTFQSTAYAIALAMCARSFGEYLATAAPGMGAVAISVAALAILAAVTVANLAGTGAVTRTEVAVVSVEAALLLALITMGAFTGSGLSASPARAGGLVHIIAGAALMYTSFQGFAVVTNASGNMARPQRTVPLATTAAMSLVALLYVGVAVVLVHRVPAPEIVANATHVLATLGADVAGEWGLLLVSGCALIANASVLNTSMFAAGGGISYQAGEGQLPRRLAGPLWRGGTVGTLVLSIGVAVAVCILPLSALGELNTLMFLAIYGAIGAGHVRLRHITGAKRWVLVASVAVNVVLFGAVLVRSVVTKSPATYVTLPILVAAALMFQMWWRSRNRPATTSAPISPGGRSGRPPSP